MCLSLSLSKRCIVPTLVRFRTENDKLGNYPCGPRLLILLCVCVTTRALIDNKPQPRLSTGVPVSWMMVAPSITPNRSGGPNNPGIRLYKFETNTGQVSSSMWNITPKVVKRYILDVKYYPKSRWEIHSSLTVQLYPKNCWDTFFFDWCTTLPQKLLRCTLLWLYNI